MMATQETWAQRFLKEEMGETMATMPDHLLIYLRDKLLKAGLPHCVDDCWKGTAVGVIVEEVQRRALKSAKALAGAIEDVQSEVADRAILEITEKTRGKLQFKPQNAPLGEQDTIEIMEAIEGLNLEELRKILEKRTVS